MHAVSVAPLERMHPTLQACCTTLLRTAAMLWGWTKSTSTLARRCGASWKERPSSGGGCNGVEGFGALLIAVQA